MCKFRLKYTYCQWKAVIAAAVKQLWRAQRQCTLPWKGMCKFWLKDTYCQWKAVIAATVKQLWRAQRQCTLPCGWFLYEEKVASPFLTWSRSMIVCRVGYSLEETGEDGLYRVFFGVRKSRYRVDWKEEGWDRAEASVRPLCLWYDNLWYEDLHP